jgi:hypothetical protein
MNANEWLSAYAQRLPAPAPTAEEVDAVLALAGVAAHGSERIAAPVACWMAARAGLGLAEALAMAQEVSGDERA